MDGALMQVNLCPSTNIGKASCSVLGKKKSLNTESEAVVNINHAVTAICPVDGQITVITEPFPDESTDEDSPIPLKRKCSVENDPNYEVESRQPGRKNKLWLQENMTKAICAVKSGMNVRAASKQFSVPRTTLKNRLCSSGSKTNQENGKRLAKESDFSHSSSLSKEINKKFSKMSGGGITVHTSRNGLCASKIPKGGSSSNTSERDLTAQDKEDAEKDYSNGVNGIKYNGHQNTSSDATQFSKVQLSESSQIGNSKTIESNPSSLTIIHKDVIKIPNVEKYIQMQNGKEDTEANSSTKRKKKKFKKWSEESMALAVEAINRGARYKDVSTLFGIPHSTLGNRVLAARRKVVSAEVRTGFTTANDGTKVYKPILPAPIHNEASKQYPFIVPTPPEFLPIKVSANTASHSNQSEILISTVPEYKNGKLFSNDAANSTSTSNPATSTREILPASTQIKQMTPSSNDTQSTSQSNPTVSSVVDKLLTLMTLKKSPPKPRPKVRGKLKKWTEEAMQEALKALEDEGISVYAAAKKYNVPKSTLDAKRRRKHKTSTNFLESKNIANFADEYPLVCYVNACAMFGITNMKDVVLLMAAESAENRGLWSIKEQGLPPDEWWEAFCERRSNHIKNVDVTIGRMGQTIRLTKSRMNLFFDKLTAVINSSQYHKHPLNFLDHRTFSLQEFKFDLNTVSSWAAKGRSSPATAVGCTNGSSLPTSNSIKPVATAIGKNNKDPSDMKIIDIQATSNRNCNSSASLGSSADTISEENRDSPAHRKSNNVSAMCCVNAAGSSLPTMFVVHAESCPFVTPNQEDPPNNPEYFVHNVNDVSRESDYYYKWFGEVFLANAPQVRPLILLIDPDFSFITPEFITLANLNQIILLCFPPLSSQFMQPLNVIVYPALQQGFRSPVVMSKFAQDAHIDSENFPEFFKLAWTCAINVNIIKSGFHKTGICPINRKVFDNMDFPAI